MNTLRLVCLTLPLAFACTLLHAGGGQVPAPTGFFVQILHPTPAPVFTTFAPTVTLAGVVYSPHVPVAQITYSSSSGASGPCTIVSNRCWRSEPIALLAGTNLLAVTAVQAGENGLTASDELIAIRIMCEPPIWTNQPPVWTNRPPVWTNHPPVCTNLPPVCSNRPPVIVSFPPLFWATNNLYRYHLVAFDRENDPMTLHLAVRGPVITAINPLTNGEWMIHAILTNYVPVVRFKAVVSDAGPRPVVQRWGVFVPRGMRPQPTTRLNR